MSWRPDEIWLDTEMLWFRERSSGHAGALVANAPSFFGAGRGRISAIPIPNGLAESRRRRAELRRQRTVRRTRAAADRKSTRLNSSHMSESRMPSSA